MKTYVFDYEHNHGDTSWDEFIIPIVDEIEVEAENQEQAEDIAYQKAESQIRQLAEELADQKDDAKLWGRLQKNQSPFDTNSLKAIEK